MTRPMKENTIMVGVLVAATGPCPACIIVSPLTLLKPGIASCVLIFYFWLAFSGPRKLAQK